MTDTLDLSAHTISGDKLTIVRTKNGRLDVYHGPTPLTHLDSEAASVLANFLTFEDIQELTGQDSLVGDTE